MEENILEFLAVGESAFFQAEAERKDAPRYRVGVRGWKDNEYLMFDMPLLENGRPILLRKDQRCIIRFFREGEAYGFEGSLIDWDPAKTYPIIRVRWPGSIEHVGVRRHERVATQIPCKACDGEGSDFKAKIMDLSAGGCRLETTRLVTVDEQITLSFELPDKTQVNARRAIVRNTKSCQAGLNIGCEFLGDNTNSSDDIGYFVSTTAERLHPNLGTRNARVLILEDNRDVVDGVREVLEGIGHDLVAANGLVDVFYRLRTAQPSLLLISFNQREIQALKICRIIRNTPGFGSLPIFIYGGPGGNAEEDAKKAGATGYLIADVMVASLARMFKKT